MTTSARLNTALAGRYVIERQVGQGGMATVWLARDLKHNRPVALKLLNPELGAVLGTERFLSEIQVTAHLQHPNLLPLFDSGEADGLLFYVMPFVEGESLRSRLEREKQLPVDEAVQIAILIAGALHYAHAQGVIHRDLKPENILMQAGQPVIADFGIALAVSNAGGARITQTGLSLGTPQYMSPEQATGDRVIDGRTDIYSLGCIVYEMLLGDPPHVASTAQAVIAKVLTDRPRPVRAMRPAVPEHVEQAVSRSLEKLPADRYSTAREFADALLGRGAPTSASIASDARVGTSRPERRWSPYTVGATLVAVAAIATAVAFGRMLQSRQLTTTTRFTIGAQKDVVPEYANTWAVTMSPDGHTLVFTGRGADGRLQLYRRALDELDAHAIPGTPDPAQPVFSPDGRWIAYLSQDRLRKVPLDGGTPQIIADAGGNNGMDWSPEGVIVLGAERGYHGLSKVPADGGGLQHLTVVDSSKNEVDHVWPTVLPDGKTVVFTIWSGSLQSSELAVTSIDGGPVSRLNVSGIAPVGLASGQLVYATAEGNLMAVPFNERKRLVTGTPRAMVSGISVCGPCNGDAAVRLSRSGSLIYMTGGNLSHLAWLTPQHTILRLPTPAQSFANPRLSPDGKRIAVAVSGDAPGIWIYEIAGGTMTRLTTGAASDVAPVWTPDSRRIAYFVQGASRRVSNGRALSIQPADGSGAPEILLSSRGAIPMSISPDGHTLLFLDFIGGLDLLTLDLHTKQVSSYLGSPAYEGAGAFSPDGKYVAYVSNEGGAAEVYVRQFPNTGGRVQVSVNGGNTPVWSRDGHTLFYRSRTQVIAAAVATSPTFQVRSRSVVAEGAFASTGDWLADYDAGAGSYPLLLLESEQADLGIVVVTNWSAELRRRIASH